MASQAFIIDLEDEILATETTVAKIREGVVAELEASGANRLYPENGDCWGTMAVNLHNLANKAKRLADLIDAKR
jgi:hypothetical protein